MAMIQNEKEVHFTGMTRVQLDGNKIIATQNGEAQVTISANTRSLTELADKISESAAKKEVVTDQEMLDRAIVEKYRGHCGRYQVVGGNPNFWYNGKRLKIEDFIEFYLSANRLNYSLEEMRKILCLGNDPTKKFSTDSDVMSMAYMKQRLNSAQKCAEYNGFTLPALKNTGKNEPTLEDKLSALNWAG